MQLTTNNLTVKIPKLSSPLSPSKTSQRKQTIKGQMQRQKTHSLSLEWFFLLFFSESKIYSFIQTFSLESVEPSISGFFFQTKKLSFFVSFTNLFSPQFCSPLFLDSMLRIEVEDSVSSRASLEKPRVSISLSAPTLLDINNFSRKSFSYSKLPEEPIKLSIKKLDGSSFGTFSFFFFCRFHFSPNDIIAFVGTCFWGSID